MNRMRNRRYCEGAKHIGMFYNLLDGNGIDIGSGGWPIVPWAIQIELSIDKFEAYNQRVGAEPIEWMDDSFTIEGGFALPFRDGVLDWIYCSHVIEDFSRTDHWPKIFAEWSRCLKKGGAAIVLVPEVKLWAEALAKGQPPNCAHWAPEPSVGDMSKVAVTCGFETLREELTDQYEGDYSILGLFKKL